MPTVSFATATSFDVYVSASLARTASFDVTAPSPPLVLDDGRCGPFEMVTTDFMVRGTTRVTWTLRDNFAGKLPFTFQLQVGETGNPLADDWRDVGPPVVNGHVALDPEERMLGKQLVVHYRVKLTDDDGVTYASQPATVLGRLGMRDWLQAREIIRQQRLRLRQFAGVEGLLLKRKRSGVPCTVCLDPDSNMILNSDCPVCKGTRFVAGYYRALPLQYCDMNEQPRTERRTGGPEGWSLPAAVTGLFIGTPVLSSGDLWVDAASDLRYYIETVATKGRVRGVPVLFEVVMSQLPPGNVAYTIPLEGT